jgi:hypothetical protein
MKRLMDYVNYNVEQKLTMFWLCKIECFPSSL